MTLELTAEEVRVKPSENGMGHSRLRECPLWRTGADVTGCFRATERPKHKSKYSTVIRKKFLFWALTKGDET